MTKGIDPNRIGIAGDSARASLSVASILVARRHGDKADDCKESGVSAAHVFQSIRQKQTKSEGVILSQRIPDGIGLS